jgi:hypothetical protein
MPCLAHVMKQSCLKQLGYSMPLSLESARQIKPMSLVALGHRSE